MKPASTRKPGPERILLAFAAAGAAILTLTASECKTTTSFPEYVKEICSDDKDNDEDGRIDCKDSDCSGECNVSVTIDDFSKPVLVDSFQLTGTQSRATSVVVNISPTGVGGSATLENGTWKRSLSGLTADTTYTLKVIAANGEIKDTATTTFERKH